MQQGFVNENAVVKTVSDALKANDDTPVRLEGQIVKQLGKKDFILKTASVKKFKLKSIKSVERHHSESSRSDPNHRKSG
ncbi:Uncharacterized conserved protein [Rodentibacter pneumotropicus]|uniref:Uncharacterized conserved protein n=1 Tax=Rodentibacter pneumotropicus TaxID=758 RepID=A0A3S4Y4L4_9PAST|nr:Uncharacterized conserved protein [Rodentibacter pneumotropicus]